jgi:hypothetical protein
MFRCSTARRWRWRPASASVSSAATAAASPPCSRSWPVWRCPTTGCCSCRPACGAVYVAQEPEFRRRQHGVRCGQRRCGRGAGAARTLTNRTSPATTWMPADAPGSPGRLDLGAARDQALQRLRLDPTPGGRPLGRHCASAWPWRARWWKRPTCCCWTSPPTTWTWTPSSGCRNCCRAGAARWSCLARPRLHRRGGHAHRRAGPRSAAQLPRSVRSAYEATKLRELESEALANARADKLLAQEEVWIRKGVEARRTRSVGRVQRLVSSCVNSGGAPRHAGPVRLDAGCRPAARQDRGRAGGEHALPSSASASGRSC